MGKQYSTHYVSWRDAKKASLGLFANEKSYAAAASSALETKLSDLTTDGWIIDRVVPLTGVHPKQCGFTIIAFK